MLRDHHQKCHARRGHVAIALHPLQNHGDIVGVRLSVCAYRIKRSKFSGFALHIDKNTDATHHRSS